MKKKETKDSKVTTNISRRDFLKGAGFVIGGAAAFGSAGILSACSKTTTETSTLPANTVTSTTTLPPTTVTSTPSAIPSSWDYTADIAIIGASAMGLPAAMSGKRPGSFRNRS